MEGIYLVGNREFGWYKIGMSQNVEERAETISDLVPFAVELLAAWPCQRKYLRKLELHLHRTFAESKIKGEWFRLSTEDGNRIDATIQAWRAEKGLPPAKQSIQPDPLGPLGICGDVWKMFAEGFTINDLTPVNDPSYTFRFAEARDSETFAHWATNNALISKDDLLASLKQNNPTSVTLVIEKDGVPVVFAPFYCQMNLGFLGFNPDLQGRVRLQGLHALRNAVSAFAAMHGVREITVQSSDNYPVAQWALHNGFQGEKRKTFRMRLTDGENGLAVVTN
jgi:hypothetical protein